MTKLTFLRQIRYKQVFEAYFGMEHVISATHRTY